MKGMVPVIDRIFQRDQGVCWICLESGPIIAFTRDHLIPHSLGGSSGLWNLRLAHLLCNNKRDRQPPPMKELLKYCTTDGMEHRAKRMLYRAYPELRPNPISRAKVPAKHVDPLRQPRKAGTK